MLTPVRVTVGCQEAGLNSPLSRHLGDGIKNGMHFDTPGRGVKCGDSNISVDIKADQNGVALSVRGTLHGIRYRFDSFEA